MNVSRQAVSKWESAQSAPDLEKILELGTLFGVTTDYLLKDEMEDEQFLDNFEEIKKCVSLKDANNYLELKRKSSWHIALATFLFFFSPIPIIMLNAFSNNYNTSFTNVTANIVGLVLLFVFVISSIAIYAYCNFINSPYKFYDRCVPFELEYGVYGTIKEKLQKFKVKYIKVNIIAICIFVLAPIPLIVSAFLSNIFIILSMLCVTILIADIGASIAIIVGAQYVSLQKLLKAGEYTLEKRRSIK